MTTRPAASIVLGPVITERTYQLYTQGRYTFRVLATASKTDIRNASRSSTSPRASRSARSTR